MHPAASARRGRRRFPELGQATVMMAAVIALSAVVLFAVARFASVLIDAAQARTAADAAALAGVQGGASAAARLADSNNAALVRFSRVGNDVVVTVRVGRATATARAGVEDLDESAFGGGDARRNGTQSDAQRAPPATAWWNVDAVRYG